MKRILFLLFTLHFLLVADEPIYEHVLVYPFPIYKLNSVVESQIIGLPPDQLPEGNRPQNYRINFFQSGRIVRSELYYYRGRTGYADHGVDLIEYFYENNLLVEKQITGRNPATYKYSYDTDERLVRIDFLHDGTFQYLFYDEHNQCIETKAYYLYEDEEILILHMRYEFNDDSQLTTRYDVPVNGTTELVTYYQYNSDGLLSRVEMSGFNYVEEISYNELNNPIQIFHYRDGIHIFTDMISYQP